MMILHAGERWTDLLASAPVVLKNMLKFGFTSVFPICNDVTYSRHFWYLLAAVHFPNFTFTARV